MRKIKNNEFTIALLISGFLFVIDLLTPLGDAEWILYVIPLLIVSSQPCRVYILGITALTWLLIVAGYFLSPRGLNPTLDLVNRCLGMAVQAVIGFVLVQRNRVREELEQRREELEKEVEARIVVERELREAQDILIEARERERQAEAKFRQAQKMEALGTLAGGIAHDFKNILAAIIGFSEMAIGKTAEGTPARVHMERVFSAGLRGRELVNQILTFSHGADQEKRPLQLSVVVQETLSFVTPSLPATVGVKVNVNSESGVVLADPVQMQQVVMNLCINAAHAMGQKRGTIVIDLSDCNLSPEEVPGLQMRPGFYMRLSVSDTGEGMSREILDHIFEPFFTTKTEGEGTGLGLSVVHGIITSHGGAITVSSEPGMGSTFTIYLPRHLGAQRQDPVVDKSTTCRGQEQVFVVARTFSRLTC